MAATAAMTTRTMSALYTLNSLLLKEDFRHFEYLTLDVELSLYSKKTILSNEEDRYEKRAVHGRSIKTGGVQAMQLVPTGTSRTGP